MSACILYVVVSLTELPAFQHSGQGAGKDWYEIVLEIICDTIFVADIYMQVRTPKLS